jgi:hypothetical protein
MQDRLTAAKSKPDPAQQFYHELTELVVSAHAQKGPVLLWAATSVRVSCARRLQHAMQ